MKRCLVSLIAVVLLGVPSAFGQTWDIDFAAIYERTVIGIGSNLPTGTFRLDAESGCQGVRDMELIMLLAEVLKTPTSPHHAAILGAFDHNYQAVRANLGGAQSTLMQMTKSQELIPGTTNQYFAIDAVLAWLIMVGQWDTYADLCVLPEFRANAPATQLPDPADYDLSVVGLLGVCDDLDGDGTPNGEEYWANGDDWPAVMNPGISDGQSKWDVWCVGGASGVSWRLNYNSDNGRVYFMLPSKVLFSEVVSLHGRVFRHQPNTVPVKVRMAEIWNAGENAFVRGLFQAKGGRAWLGGFVPPGVGSVNTDDWRWFSAPDTPMTYRNWATAEPNNYDGYEYALEMQYETGRWNDIHPERRDYRLWAVYETEAPWPDDDTSGVPDAWEDPDYLWQVIPQADFTADVTSGTMPLLVQFTDASDVILEGDPPIVSWLWDLGNGNTYSGQTPPPQRYRAAAPPLEKFTVSLTVSNSNGLPITETKTDFITVEYDCSWGAKAAEQGTAVADDPGAVNAQLAAQLAAMGMDTWYDWDLDSDGVPDAAQLALLGYIACLLGHPLCSEAGADLDANVVMWEAQFAGVSALLDNSVLFAGLVGLSADMQAALEGILGEDLSGYAICGDAMKAAPHFSGAGDPDGDGLTNLMEWQEVVEVHGTADMEKTIRVFIKAATSGPFWPGNPDLPVTGAVGFGILAGVLLMGAGFTIRKKAR